MTTFRFDDDPDNRDTGPDYFLRNPGRDRYNGPAQPDEPDDFNSEEPRRRGKWRSRLAVILLVIFGVAFGAGYVRYFVPHTSVANLRGDVTSMETRGIMFKVTEMRLREASGETIDLSVPDDSLARLISAAMVRNIPVTLSVDKYFAPVPWRGESANIVTAIQQ